MGLLVKNDYNEACLPVFSGIRDGSDFVKRLIGR